MVTDDNHMGLIYHSACTLTHNMQGFCITMSKNNHTLLYIVSGCIHLLSQMFLKIYFTWHLVTCHYNSQERIRERVRRSVDETKCYWKKTLLHPTLSVSISAWVTSVLIQPNQPDYFNVHWHKLTSYSTHRDSVHLCVWIQVNLWIEHSPEPLPLLFSCAPLFNTTFMSEN